MWSMQKGETWVRRHESAESRAHSPESAAGGNGSVLWPVTRGSWGSTFKVTRCRKAGRLDMPHSTLGTVQVRGLPFAMLESREACHTYEAGRIVY